MIVDMKFLNYVRENYPEAWEWIRCKANWEHITLGAVAHGYRNHIDKLIVEEDSKKSK